MRTSFSLVIHSVIMLISTMNIAMEPSTSQLFISFKSPSGQLLGTIPSNIVQLNVAGFNNTITTYIEPSFVSLLQQLLFAQNLMSCTKRPYLKCAQDIQLLLNQNTQPAMNTQFVSWFELAYLLEMFNVPHSIQDPVIRHITEIVKDHEHEAANQTAALQDTHRTLSYIEIWAKIASYYNALFAQELVIDKKHVSLGMSIRELLMLGKINHNRVNIIAERDTIFMNINLKKLNISSLDGWDYIAALIKDKNLRTIQPYSHMIRTINLSSNLLTTLPPNFLSDCPNLKQVKMHNNQITQLPSTFLMRCPKLESLYLDDNQLASLPNNFLSNCFKLKELYIDQNHLTSLPQGFLSSCPLLKFIDLSENSLITLPGNFLSECPKLEECFIDNNSLTSLPNLFLSNAPNLRAVDISDNTLLNVPSRFLSKSLIVHELLIHNKDGSIPEHTLPPLPYRALKRTRKKQEISSQKRKPESNAPHQPDPKRSKK